MSSTKDRSKSAGAAARSKLSRNKKKQLTGDELKNWESAKSWDNGGLPVADNESAEAQQPVKVDPEPPVAPAEAQQPVEVDPEPAVKVDPEPPVAPAEAQQPVKPDPPPAAAEEPEPPAEVRYITIEVPIAAVDPEKHSARHIDVQLTRDQATAHRAVFNGLDAAGIRLADGRRITAAADVLRFLCERIGEGRKGIGD